MALFAKQVLVTGASGFVGRHLLRELVRREIPVIATARSISRAEELRREFPTVTVKAIPEGADLTTWISAFAGVDSVVHLGALAHLVDKGSQSEAFRNQAFQKVNVEWSSMLAQAARAAGIRKFIYLSSVKALGDTSAPGRPFSASTFPQPRDDYGRSKLAAEATIKKFLDGSSSVYVLRTPLIYGPEVKANFLSLLRAAWLKLPLPIGSVQNHRSLLYVGNLTNLISHLVTNNLPPGTYYVTDSEAVSTAKLFSMLAAGLDVPCRMLPCPPAALAWGLRLLNKRAVADRLLGDLEVDSTQTSDTLGWSPPIDLESAIKETTEWFRRTTAKGS